MDINKKNRSDLKSYFVKNSIPTESNFGELIDGMLNQKDDGIVKLSGEPLSIESAGDLTGLQKVINFYAKFQDANPSWSLQLNPRSDPNTPSTAKAGFCVADGQSVSRLFIDKTTGNLGVGTITPQAGLTVVGAANINDGNGWANANGKMAIGSLTIGSITANYGGANTGWTTNTAGLLLETLANTEIAVHDSGTRVASLMYYEGEGTNRITIGRNMGGTNWGSTPVTIADNLTVNGTGNTQIKGMLTAADAIRLGLDEGGSGTKCISFVRDAGDEGNAGKITYKGGFGTDSLHIIGAGGASGKARKVKLWDDVNISQHLTVNGAITLSIGNSANNGVIFKNNIGGDTTDSAWIRYYARSAELMTLEIGTANDNTDHIAFMPSGNVGIGVNNPLYSLDVSASRGIKLGLEGYGGGQLILKNNKDDNRIYLEAFSKDGASSAAELLLTGMNATSVPKLSLLTENTLVSGNLIVKGSILEQNPLIDTNYAIELCGSAIESTEGNITFLKVNNVAMDMTTLRGLNTVILNPNGSYKNKANHDVYLNATAWNTWADWVNSNAAFGDIVAVATFDAINNAPRSGSADVLLSSILAEKAYTAVTGSNQRTPYALVFMKGGVAVEAASTYKGTNAHLNAVSCKLPINRDQWRNAVLINNWVRWDNTYNPAQYFKDSKGLVSLRGLVKSGAAGSVIFTLPEGYRPNYRQLHVVCASDAVGRVDILSNGQVVHISGSTGWVSLDSISFSTKA